MKTKQNIPVQQGTVYWRNRDHYWVHCAENIIVCTLSYRQQKNEGSKNRKKGVALNLENALSDVAVGDHVLFRMIDAEKGMILERLQRRNTISRRTALPMPGACGREQVIAANMDVMLPVISAVNPAPTWGLLDRYLVLAESMALPSFICLTKMDLLDESSPAGAEVLSRAQLYRSLGYTVLPMSIKTGQGYEAFLDSIQGKIGVLLGKSGSGKTSILDKLLPELQLKTGQVSMSTKKGKHTTSHIQIYPLQSGGLADTPGSREFAMWKIDEEELPACFPEMRRWEGCCKFGSDCFHLDEPGCAIRKAVTAGEIDPYRYRSYVKLILEMN